MALIRSIVLSGGPVPRKIEGYYYQIPPIPVPTEITTVPVYSSTEFTDSVYLDSVALIMSKGDYNAIMFTNYDEWRNLASLTIDNILYNLTLRANINMPAMVGKYMLSSLLIKDHCAINNIPGYYWFSPLIQDQLAASVTNMFATKLQNLNIVVDNENLFACHYFGSAEAWAAIVNARENDLVSIILHNAGFYTTPTNNFADYDRNTFVYKIKEIYRLAEKEVIWRKSNNQSVIASGQTIPFVSYGAWPNAQMYIIGNEYYTDGSGGYFKEYAIPDVNVVASTFAKVGPPTVIGSVGTVSFKLEDAAAAALAGVLQTTNTNDQAGIAQIIVNRTGGTVTEKVSFVGYNGFDNATAVDAFSALSAALYGPNDNVEASALYGNLYIEHETLRAVFNLSGEDNYKSGLQSVFDFRLSDTQLNRAYVLRTQVYNNGPELQQAQLAIKGAINIVGPSVPTSSSVFKPFGVGGSGYVITPLVPGFYIPNTADAAASSPAPTIDALLNRLLENIKNPPSNIVIPYGAMLDKQANNLPGSNIVASGNTEVYITELDVRRVTNQPGQPDTGNFTGGIPKITPDYPSYDIHNNWIGPGSGDYNAS